MPGKILGLDVRNDLITAVQVTSGLKNYEIISCCQVIIDEDGPLKAIESISQKMDIKSDICAAVIPAEEVSIRAVLHDDES